MYLCFCRGSRVDPHGHTAVQLCYSYVSIGTYVNCQSAVKSGMTFRVCVLFVSFLFFGRIAVTLEVNKTILFENTAYYVAHCVVVVGGVGGDSY